MTAQIELQGHETCIYRLLGARRSILDANLDISCNDGDFFLVSDKNVLGPFCSEPKRKKRQENFNIDLVSFLLFIK